MEPNLKLCKDDGPLFEDIKYYRKLVGKLQYLTITRLDISFSVSKLAQYSFVPHDPHVQALHKVLCYLKGSIGHGLFYSSAKTFDVRGYRDSDWGACPDTRRFVSGYAMFVGQSLISWKSKKQATVSLSSAEAEYRSMSVATKELIWLTSLLRELHVPFEFPAYLYCDNTAALHIASNPIFHERTKHIEMECHKVRGQIAEGMLKTMYVRTTDQLADVLTKALYPAPFRDNIGKMGLHNIYAASS